MFPKSTSSQQGSHPASFILQPCTAVVQGCRYLRHIWPALPDRQLLSLGDYSPRHVMKGSPARSWGVKNFATVQSTGSSSFPSLHTILVKVKDFLAVLESTQIIGFCHELRFKTSLHFKKVEGVEQGRGGRYFCLRFGSEKGIDSLCMCFTL